MLNNNTSLNPQKLKDANRMLKLGIQEGKQSFFAHLNKDLKEKHKVLWKYIKIGRSDDTSSPALKSDGTTLTANAENVEMFIRYFKSVFSNRTISDTSESLPPKSSSADIMPKINIDVLSAAKVCGICSAWRSDGKMHGCVTYRDTALQS